MNQISPLAFVHPEAKLGDNNIIGPFCYIDKNTVIGDNNNFRIVLLSTMVRVLEMETKFLLVQAFLPSHKT